MAASPKPYAHYNIVLDMDGVAPDSESVKITTFATLFADYPDQLAAIDRYNRTHRGIPRSEKFTHVLTSILGLSAEEHNLQILGERYKSMLARELSDVPLVGGIECFLQLSRFSFFLNSSAPVEEIEKLMHAKALSQYFQNLYGYPYSKVEVLRQLKNEHQNQPLLFFGDAWADYQAAQSSGVRFIGVDAHNSATFKDVDVSVIRDFSNLDQIISLIEDCA